MGKTLGGRYTLLQRLGSGGMASVYLARDDRLLRPVAIKILRDYQNSHDIFLFHREARAIAALQHHNVVNILDYSGREELPAYIVMELIEGQSLKDILNYHGPWPVPAIMAMGHGLLSGLKKAHKLGIVHRDIKPANIMLDEEGRIVLMDFGLAKSIKIPAMLGKTTLSKRTWLSGTPDYISPEQVMGLSWDEKVDIFAVGALFYTLATGEPPFHKGNEMSTMQAIADHNYIPLSRLGLGLDPVFMNIVAKCLEYHPKDRPNAKWVWQKCDEWLAGHGWSPERLLRDFQLNFSAEEAGEFMPSEQRKQPMPRTVRLQYKDREIQAVTKE